MPKQRFAKVQLRRLPVTVLMHALSSPLVPLLTWKDIANAILTPAYQLWATCFWRNCIHLWTKFYLIWKSRFDWERLTWCCLDGNWTDVNIGVVFVAAETMPIKILFCDMDGNTLGFSTWLWAQGLGYFSIKNCHVSTLFTEKVYRLSSSLKITSELRNTAILVSNLLIDRTA